jgi:hypothetical protein
MIDCRIVLIFLLDLSDFGVSVNKEKCVSNLDTDIIGTVAYFLLGEYRILKG